MLFKFQRSGQQRDHMPQVSGIQGLDVRASAAVEDCKIYTLLILLSPTSKMNGDMIVILPQHVFGHVREQGRFAQLKINGLHYRQIWAKVASR